VLDDTGGRLVFEASGTWEPVSAEAAVRSVGADQSNNSLVLDERVLLKIYRRLREGTQPEIEMSRFLSQVAGFANTPAMLGVIEHRPADGPLSVLGALFAFVRNQGDCWQAIVGALERHLDDVLLIPAAASGGANEELPWAHPLDLPAVIGRRTAEMHNALATRTSDPAFASEPIEQGDVVRWTQDAMCEAAAALDAITRLRPQLAEAEHARVDRLLAARSSIESRIEGIGTRAAAGLKTRIHGDYHLGQILIAETDVVIIDFEGEPRRSIEERRAKASPLRDVAGLLRSLDYAAWAALQRVAIRNPELPSRVADAAMNWRAWAREAFLSDYSKAIDSTQPQSASRGLLDLFLLQKAFYEISYEAASRPDWLTIPLRGALDLLTSVTRRDDA
jgi:maltose alpha-D-glucosyltransferase/alpha-amylase